MDNDGSCGFDAAWDALDSFQESTDSGRLAGREMGRQMGRTEGYRIGQTTALNYGLELGFMRGVVVALLDDDSSPIVQMIDEFRTSNDPRVAMQRIRARFRLLVTQHGRPRLSLQSVVSPHPQSDEW